MTPPKWIVSSAIINHYTEFVAWTHWRLWYSDLRGLIPSKLITCNVMMNHYTGFVAWSHWRLWYSDLGLDSGIYMKSNPFHNS